MELPEEMFEGMALADVLGFSVGKLARMAVNANVNLVVSSPG